MNTDKFRNKQCMNKSILSSSIKKKVDTVLSHDVQI